LQHAQISKRKKPAPEITSGSGLFIEIIAGDHLISHTLARAVPSAQSLNFRVRDENGWDPRGMVTGKLKALTNSTAPKTAISVQDVEHSN
jgi:hypothetical protein